VSRVPAGNRSGVQAEHLAHVIEGRYRGHVALNIYSYGVSWYTVGPSQRTTRVRFSNCQHKPATPVGLYGPGGQFEDVPIPDHAVATTGTDGALTIYQPSSDTLWDLWRASRDGGWSACWGGRIDQVSTSSGQFPGHFGASASGLASEAGAVSIADVESGSIDHAVSLSLPADLLARGHSWPATRGDGRSTSPLAISEGNRLRLDPTLDVDRLHLSPLARLVARAAQRYGFIVTDRSGVVSVPSESPAASKQLTGRDPWASLLDGRQAYRVLDGFPWDRVEVLPRDFGKSLSRR
jgi:hypothetical protein